MKREGYRYHFVDGPLEGRTWEKQPGAIPMVDIPQPNADSSGIEYLTYERFGVQDGRAYYRVKA